MGGVGTRVSKVAKHRVCVTASPGAASCLHKYNTPDRQGDVGYLARNSHRRADL
jgi:hypothetical protein